ncbi:hypothetical protein LOTGIDRAFT_230877 [Lottia gigantea]|uniref:TIR domain-containing protein n=1 Tax=Lottia gigantea TaxID=225164 RepID=V4AY29_LOTGI|nr:hypothetical protein LOTGIDRAFT_230877 [Lottia gigantea]ESO99950.1 hypothetical protein LOTGIDRAFT_230877 [Lottia gigantea]
MIIHNVAMTDANIPLLQELKFAPVLKNYLSFTNDTIKLTAILGLADIMTEEESHYVETNNEVIIFLLMTFKRALFASSRTAKDGNGMIWGVLELAKGIGRLASNDGNKKLLVEKGSLPLLLKLAKSDDLEEQKEALKSMWALAFNEENQDKIIELPGLIEFLDDKNRTGFSDTRSTCYGILWTMRTKLQQSSQFKAIGDRLVVKKTMSPSKTFTEKGELETSEKDSKNKGHVMISYQWGDQEILKRVRDKIRGSKKKVWMDIDDMEGSTLQAMADAVENADIVLICMSRKYKDSPNCRAEAEYAHQLRKTVIPLIMERSYKPDGWLGMILGAKLFYDFSGKYPFESKIEGLLREISQKLNLGDGAVAGPTGSKGVDVVDGPDQKIVPVQNDMVYAPYKAPPPKLGEVKSWNAAQVKDWLKKYGLSGTRVEKLTGREIAFLQKLQASTPEYYYMTVKTDLGIKTLTDMANFEEAMDELPQLS